MQRGETAGRLIVGTVGLLSFAARAPAPCQYSVITFQGPSCEFTESPTRGRGINEAGQVVGDYTLCALGPGEACLWDGSLVTVDRPPGVTGAGAWDINDFGLIIGQMTLDGIATRAFLHDGTQFIDLGVPPGGNLSQGRAINSQGQIVGVWGGPGDLPALAAFLWEDGNMVDLNAVLGTPLSEALDINDTGRVAGWMGLSPYQDGEAFVWQDGKVTALGNLPNGSFSVALGVNELGQVAGYALIGNFPNYSAGRPFLWEEGEMHDLGSLPGFDRTAAMGINDIRQIVGRAWGVAGNPNIESAFIWQHGTMYDLNDLTVSNTGIEILGATAINNQGQITGRGRNANGDTVGVLLTPADIPAGDLDCDCAVRFDDFQLLLAAWGPCPARGECGGDVDGDGSVGVVDFLLLLANWTG
jgi:probable HAF family extracellular repeat protein